MPIGTQPIEDVPADITDDPVTIYNPLDEDFEFYWNRVKEPKAYVIPARDCATFPEYKARSAARQLAEMIVYRQWSEGHKDRIQKLIDKGATDPLDPMDGKPMPPNEIKRVVEVIMSGEKAKGMDVNVTTAIETSKESAKPIEQPKEEIDEKIMKGLKDETPDYEKMSWNDLRVAGKKEGVYKIGMKKAEVIEALKKSSQI